MAKILPKWPAICAALLTSFTLFTQGAQATPPRLLNSDDRLLAATPDHIYVLRDLIDNRGSHYSSLHDQHLVEISLVSGKATRNWPMRSVQVDRLDDDGLDTPGRLTEHRVETVDLVAQLQKLSAVPIVPFGNADFELSLDGLSLTLKDKGEVLSAPLLAQAARDQLMPLAQAYPGAQTTEELALAKAIEFYDLSDSSEWSCTLIYDQYFLWHPTPQRPPSENPLWRRRPFWFVELSPDPARNPLDTTINGPLPKRTSTQGNDR